MIINEDFKLALEYVENTGMSVFLTGKAGTGKTTFLKYVTERTAKRFVILAPTGVAAINAGGVTIHSFFQLPLCPYLPDVKELVTEYQMPSQYRTMRKERLKLIRSLDLLVIDEISMVRADLLDAVDMSLRNIRRNNRPFGGVQLLMVGDAQQLSPVVKDSEREYLERVYPSPFFFDSKALRSYEYVTIQLTQVFRQQDVRFLEILNAIRDNRAGEDVFAALNSRFKMDFDPDEDGWIRLTTHNRQADEVNKRKLDALPGESRTFSAQIDGIFPENNSPAEQELCLKEGAQVMFVRNDSSGLSDYYNGKIAKVLEISAEDEVTVVDEEGNSFAVENVTWTNYSYSVGSSGDITQNVDGTFTQLPLRLAWAVTIHKSQGLTFDKVIIDASRAFAFGQVYVALSRCRSLEGIVLSSKLSYSCIFQNNNVRAFNNGFSSVDELEASLEARKREYSFTMIRECVGFEDLSHCFNRLLKICKSSLESLYPSQCAKIEELTLKVRGMEEVSKRFIAQLTRLEAVKDDKKIAERLGKAADYYLPDLQSVSSTILPLLKIEIDDKEVKKRFKEVSNDLSQALRVAVQSMIMIRDSGFSLEGFHKIKLDALLNVSVSGSEKKKKAIGEASVVSSTKRPSKDASEAPSISSSVATSEEARDIYNDNRHPEVIQALIEWRRAKYTEKGVPAYVILHQKALLEIADSLPQTREELLKVKGFGKKKCENYGQEILDIISGLSIKSD